MALARWQATIQDAMGNVMPGAMVSIRSEFTGQLVSAFADRDGLVTKGNPFAADANAYAFAHLPGGAYRITATKPGLEPVEWRYVGVGLGSESDLSFVPLGEDVPQVDELAARDAFDDEPAGFRIIVSDIGDGRAALYTMGSGGSGDWSDPAILTGNGLNGAPGSSDVVGTSTTSLAVGTGSKTFTIVEETRGWGPGARLRAASDANGANFMEGIVASYSGNTLQVAVDLVGGSGTHADWTINLAGEPGTGGADGTDGIDGADGVSFIWRGAYSSGTAYVANDVVRDSGSSWIALQATTGNPPPSLPTTSNAYWSLLVEKGQDGAGAGTVTSVGLSVPTGFSASGTPVTGSGTLAMSYAAGYQGYTSAEAAKLSGIEASADVTDAGNVGAAIHGATGKTTPVDADTFALIDSAASNVLKKLTWANLKAGVWSTLGSLIGGGTDKSTPVDADLFPIADSAASNASKKLSLTNHWSNYLFAKIFGTENVALTGGVTITPKDLGNLSGTTKTLDVGDRPIQKITNNGAGTIAPGTTVGCCQLAVINASGAGAVTTSGFTKVDGSFDTTTTSKFLCGVTVTADMSVLQILKVV